MRGMQRKENVEKPLTSGYPTLAHLLSLSELRTGLPSTADAVSDGALLSVDLQARTMVVRCGGNKRQSLPPGSADDPSTIEE